jgi:hypothetical protein
VVIVILEVFVGTASKKALAEDEEWLGAKKFGYSGIRVEKAQ